MYQTMLMTATERRNTRRETLKKHNEQWQTVDGDDDVVEVVQPRNDEHADREDREQPEEDAFDDKEVALPGERKDDEEERVSAEHQVAARDLRGGSERGCARRELRAPARRCRPFSPGANKTDIEQRQNRRHATHPERIDVGGRRVIDADEAALSARRRQTNDDEPRLTRIGIRGRDERHRTQQHRQRVDKQDAVRFVCRLVSQQRERDRRSPERAHRRNMVRP